jgi:DnaK suppressor protein
MATRANSLKEMRDRLIQQRAELERHLTHLHTELMGATSSGHLEGTSSNHPADTSSDTILVETDVSTIRELEYELREFDAALQRISLGTFGQCIECGDQIDPARLRARPTATRCLRCQTRWEMKSASERR